MPVGNDRQHIPLSPDPSPLDLAGHICSDAHRQPSQCGKLNLQKLWMKRQSIRLSPQEQRHYLDLANQQTLPSKLLERQLLKMFPSNSTDMGNPKAIPDGQSNPANGQSPGPAFPWRRWLSAPGRYWWKTKLLPQIRRMGFGLTLSLVRLRLIKSRWNRMRRVWWTWRGN